MRQKKKGTSGNATLFITRSKALAKLQLSLKDFRRMCIIKGIYPREPRKKVEGPNKTYYLTKDIQFLAHEPLLATLRDIRSHQRKMRRAKAKKETGHYKVLKENRPQYTLDHVVRERYPTFRDALADLDDALCLVHLFAKLPATLRALNPKHLNNCAKLSYEFQHYVMVSNSLQKSFVSIKGIYYQADILGTKVSWLAPHNYTQELPGEVDYRVMMTFLQFYECLLSFVLFKLYQGAGLVYPPPRDQKIEEQGAYLTAMKAVSAPSTLSAPSEVDRPDQNVQEQANQLQKEVLNMEAEEEDDDDEMPPVDLDSASDTSNVDEGETEENLSPQATLFKGLTFFVGRETPISTMEFVIRSCGGTVGWEGEGSPFHRENKGITHYIVDRPAIQGPRRMNAEYVQPQWVFDSLNALVLLPPALYAVGAPLPPHLSPFTSSADSDYKPAFQEYIERIKNGETDVVFDAAAAHASAMAAKEEQKRSRHSDGDEASRKESSGEEDGHEDVEEISGVSDADDDEDEENNAENESRDGSAEEEEEEDVKSRDRRVAENKSKKGDGKKTSKATKRDEEELKLAKMMMTKRNRRLYERIEYSKNKRKAEAESLASKRSELEARAATKKSKRSRAS